MKEIIDLKFKIVGYIKFLEFMWMWEEIKLHNMLPYDVYMCDSWFLKIEWSDRYKKGSEYNRKLSDYIIQEKCFDYYHRTEERTIQILTEFSKQLEELYSFLPKWEELNEYLYKLAVIKNN